LRKSYGIRPRIETNVKGVDGRFWKDDLEVWVFIPWLRYAIEEK
jgi:hypothetical protein